MQSPIPGYLGLGSNLGNRLANLQEALDTLGATRETDIRQVSSVYESPAHGYASPNKYLNAVIEFVWDSTPLKLLQHCYKIEAAGGRHEDPQAGSEEYEDRTIDIDILWLDGVQSLDGRLTLPHPRSHERAFVLIPWLELDPDVSLAGYSLEDWLAKLPSEEVRTVVKVPGCLHLD